MYEYIYHNLKYLHVALMLQVDSIVAGLNVTVFVKHPVTGKLHVNFDPSVFQLLKEAVHMRRMKLEVPQLALRLLDRSSVIEENYYKMKVCNIVTFSVFPLNLYMSIIFIHGKRSLSYILCS